MKNLKFNILGIIFITLLIFSLGCKTAAGTDNSGNTNTEPNTIVLNDNSFSPATMTIQAGTTITWTHRGNQVHTVTSGQRGAADGVFNSGDLNNGNTFQFTFSTPGTYNYHCLYHAGMNGVIIVQ